MTVGGSGTEGNRNELDSVLKVEESTMVTVGLLVIVEAKPGQEAAVESFLRDALPLANQEPATTAWFAVRLSESRFGVVDFFPDDEGRQKHLSGPIAQALGKRSDELFTSPPNIEPLDVLAAKLPGLR